MGQIQLDPVDPEPVQAQPELTGDPLGLQPVVRPGRIGLKVLVVSCGRTPREAIQRPIARSLRPPP